ncbi:hypothetical protein [Streptomyces pratensis]|uniref:hypothetical protein n=1 Tax=Streptomyces pratensis TaxID=1169025 RepID=UPI003017D6CD
MTTSTTGLPRAPADTLSHRRPNTRSRQRRWPADAPARRNAAPEDADDDAPAVHEPVTPFVAPALPTTRLGRTAPRGAPPAPHPATTHARTLEPAS